MQQFGAFAAVVGILYVIWFVCMFFVPFVLFGMSKALKELNQSNKELLELQLAKLSDSELSPAQLMRRYGIVEISGHYHISNKGFSGRAYKTLAEAVEEAKA